MSPYLGRIVIISKNYKNIYIYIELFEVNYENRSEDMDRRKGMDS